MSDQLNESALKEKLARLEQALMGVACVLEQRIYISPLDVEGMQYLISKALNIPFHPRRPSAAIARPDTGGDLAEPGMGNALAVEFKGLGEWHRITVGDIPATRDGDISFIAGAEWASVLLWERNRLPELRGMKHGQA